MTIYEAIFYVKNALKDIYDSGEASSIANRIVSHITGKDRLHLILDKNCDLLPEQTAQLLAYEKELLQHKPLQYILQEAWFFELKLTVNKSVLIPRPETEELVVHIIDHYRKQSLKSAHILDIGTGSGCIALALKKQLPDAIISATDISTEALDLARKNAKDHQLDIHFFMGNVLDEASVKTWPKFDIVVSNPPYISLEEAQDMEPNVLRYEPHQALFVTNQDPLQFYKAIEKAAAYILNPSGHIFLELSQLTAINTEIYFQTQGWQTKLYRDLNQHLRILQAHK